MSWKGLERNKLDYILTDTLPVEISELFSYSSFYTFLLEADQQKMIKGILNKLKIKKQLGDDTMFKDKWSSMPLKYSIIKNEKTTREMSVLHPFSAINLYLFIECYQKEILEYFRKNHCFSLRYHKKNTDLYYKGRTKKAAEYFRKQISRVGKAAIQQTGCYFKITPFESINAFTGSLSWRFANFKHNYYAKMDYKSCFDSIYTHSFSWIIERNINDAKDAKNTHLFLTIDRILQNINGRSSNGILVGPEFSRMMAEVLLERIDNEVRFLLEKDGEHWHKDYEIFRYVDDMFVFAKAPKTIDDILNAYSHICEKYRLRLNELKMEKGDTPFVVKDWLYKVRALSDRIAEIFYRGNKKDFFEKDEKDRSLVLTNIVNVDRLKDEIAQIINAYPDERRSICSYMMSTLLNNISKRNEGYNLFADNHTGKAFLIIDLALYIYAYFPCFDQTRKVISIITYINEELNFKNNQVSKEKLFSLIQRYSFVFDSNVHDICDWFPLFDEYGYHLDVQIEELLIKKIKATDDPIIWAVFMLYAKYDNRLFQKVLDMVKTILQEKIETIVDDEIMCKEFWYILIFHNCPYLDVVTNNKVEQVINKIQAEHNTNYPSDKIRLLLCTFMQRKSLNGKKPLDGFFNWNGSTSFGEQITYRTLQRTLFKKYKKNRYGLYTSVN